MTQARIALFIMCLRAWRPRSLHIEITNNRNLIHPGSPTMLTHILLPPPPHSRLSSLPQLLRHRYGFKFKRKTTFHIKQNERERERERERE